MLAVYHLIDFELLQARFSLLHLLQLLVVGVYVALAVAVNREELLHSYQLGPLHQYVLLLDQKVDLA